MHANALRSTGLVLLWEGNTQVLVTWQDELADFCLRSWIKTKTSLNLHALERSIALRAGQVLEVKQSNLHCEASTRYIGLTVMTCTAAPPRCAVQVFVREQFRCLQAVSLHGKGEVAPFATCQRPAGGLTCTVSSSRKASSFSRSSRTVHASGASRGLHTVRHFHDASTALAKRVLVAARRARERALPKFCTMRTSSASSSAAVASGPPCAAGGRLWGVCWGRGVVM